jgi:hypothetical protein
MSRRKLPSQPRVRLFLETLEDRLAADNWLSPTAITSLCSDPL